MEKLKPGIKIYLNGKEDTVLINSGTIHHSKQAPNELIFKNEKFIQQYEAEAHLPKRDWRIPTEEEYKIFTGNHKNKKDYNSVFTGEMPQNLKELFVKLDLHSATSEAEVFEKFRGNEALVHEMNIRLNAFLESISLAPFKFMSLAANFANSEIVSLDKRKLPDGYTIHDIRFIGVHKDSSKDMTLHTAHKYGNRIAFNLGKESRYLLIINLSMLQVYDMIKKKIDIRENEVNNKNITAYFLKLFPDYPVLRIEHKPYHYYIAPTDNCFHDGSTMGSTSLDILMTYLGKFLI
ncbi:hypothetical protein EGY07_13280 [Chryseobacterium indologenes]|uniref:Uncharacterized protein n=1 Tax=Chryseobacterium indologenes TaxID=253 RepID=A0AAD0YWM9_CHRID|nr:hypothetical protein [Chryseobacterium indologenes]ATN04656.1 hypothetical protein CRN76_04170 [Chryseobacterium indologenes]AYY86592.1 hypothetical protein EGX91_19590 [Chryseobacterium indologenes]AYZ36471.1 hypothetical protein EGY07_13280 [Chryseobacterium indologenes]AZB16299.1 hypothetical protein EG352_00110 [Chryseobacterium indologenes]MBF6645149.1 hypothetical protein [Chryseobacterium indologenes]